MFLDSLYQSSQSGTSPGHGCKVEIDIVVSWLSVDCCFYVINFTQIQNIKEGEFSLLFQFKCELDVRVIDVQLLNHRVDGVC